MLFPPLKLKKHEERRLKAGHRWIYSNEIDTAKTPLAQFQAGQLVQIEDSQAKPLGLGYVNPHTLLCARLLTRDILPQIDQHFFITRIQSALNLRNQLFTKPFYRLVYGEADDLPGLVVDRYGDYLVAQLTTAGMEAFKETILGALQAVLAPQAILWRNDHGMRRLEGLPEYVEAGCGEFPAEIMLEENGVRFSISAWKGQKTGWFYDHRDNRAKLQRFVTGRKVLDLFSYVGGWSVQAAAFGASEVWAVDTSHEALNRLAVNAAYNGVAERMHGVQGDVFEQLKLLAEDKQKFDVILLDPPAFIKKRKDEKQGLIAYRRVNELAMRLLNKGGFFISSSCSQHLSWDNLKQAVLAGSLKSEGCLQLLGCGGQGLDHPVCPAIPETDYLKTLFCHLA